MVHEQKFKDLLSSTCQANVERSMLDLESEVQWGNILLLIFFCFHIVKPLMPTLALLPISFNYEKTRMLLTFLGCVHTEVGWVLSSSLFNIDHQTSYLWTEIFVWMLEFLEYLCFLFIIFIPGHSAMDGGINTSTNTDCHLNDWTGSICVTWDWAKLSLNYWTS